MKKKLFTNLVLVAVLFVSSHSFAYAFIDLNMDRAMLKADAEGEVVTPAKAVLTDSDLRAYAETALREDDNLEALSFTGDRVEVSYKQQGHFLALVPMTFKAKAVAKASGEVELNYPWYTFLNLDDKEKVKIELKIAVDNALSARAVGSVRAEGEVVNPVFTPAESAEVAAQMHAILQKSLGV
ncbi:MAG: hypothetical protein AAB780_00665 [Patescibacteria group bacterium]